MNAIRIPIRSRCASASSEIEETGLDEVGRLRFSGVPPVGQTSLRIRIDKSDLSRSAGAGLDSKMPRQRRFS